MKKSLRRLVAQAVAKLPAGIMYDRDHADIFQRAGFHITKDHFYEPIPNTSEIDPAIWDKPSEMIGVDWNVDAQNLLLSELSAYFDEYRQLENEFSGIDGAALYSIIRRFAPRNILEIGAGQSSLLALAALRKNGKPFHFTTIDPYAPSYLNAQDITVLRQKVETRDPSLFEALEDSDVLFIDSSHVIRIGGDVTFEILEILPRLKRGVIVHIHDIFLPHHYPREWTLRERRFWTEQYLVQAFLAFNTSFEIIWSAGILMHTSRDQLSRYFSELDGGSLWLRRVK